jgi:hypothetical protein
MQVALELTLDFVECLLLVWCYMAWRRGLRLYLLGATGVGLAVLGRLARDIGPTAEVIGLQVFGLLLAGLVLAFYLLTEEIEDDVERHPANA